jgi:hypothetical protein
MCERGPAHPAQGFIKRPQPGGNTFRQGKFTRFADVDLIFRLQVNVGPYIVAEQNCLQIDTQNLGGLALGNMGTDDPDIILGGPGGNSAYAVQQIDHRLRSLVRHDALKAGNLSEKVELLTLVLSDADMYRWRRYTGDLGKEMRRLANCAALHTQPTFDADIDTAVRTNRPLAIPFGVGVNRHIKYVGAVQKVNLGAILTPLRQAAVGRNGKVDGGPAQGAPGHQPEQEPQPDVSWPPPR